MTVRERPLLLLDVDGPLNPYAARLPRPRGYTTHHLHPSSWLSRQTPGSRPHRRGLRVRLNPAHGPILTGLPFELAWATTWMHEANTMIAPAVGLPTDLPVIEWPELFATDPDGLYWKTRHLVECASLPTGELTGTRSTWGDASRSCQGWPASFSDVGPQVGTLSLAATRRHGMPAP
ncbi:hypothetical protein P3L51_13370 [Streptomyces sp. PSRA5]|uniref:hypothetical protein n=1 Tax=Streptomyces panacea TaxID=3035064 RepID=UPI00339BEE9C